MAKSQKLNSNEIRLSFKSNIKLEQTLKKKYNHNIFVINQLQNYVVESLLDSNTQAHLISQNMGKIITLNDGSSVFVITNYTGVRNYIIPLFNKYMSNRKISIKGLSKPIQLKCEEMLERFNLINMSPKKSHNFKITAEHLYGSFESDSSIKIIKNSYKKNGKKRTQYYLKLGRDLIKISNKKYNLKAFKLKKVTISRKNGKFYASMSGICKINLPKIDKLNRVGVDVNFENIALSDKRKIDLNNAQNKHNLYSKKLKDMQSKLNKLKDEIFNELKLKCASEGIVVYNGKKLSREAKQLYRTMLFDSIDFRQLRRSINLLYEKRVNIQNDQYKKLSNELTSSYDLIFIEKLNVANMAKSNNINKQNLYNASMSKLLNFIKNKAHTTGKIIQEVPSFFTSMKCSTKICDYVNYDLKKEDRIWICPKCGIEHDRDHNASVNIEDTGVKIFDNSLEPDLKKFSQDSI